MDGASKFVRGDAVAGILILVINIIGGLAIGTIGHGMGFGDAARTYTLLTIGDGLVAQIPALLLSTAVAIIVTRMSGTQDMGGEAARQLFGNRAHSAVAGRPARRHRPRFRACPTSPSWDGRAVRRRRLCCVTQARATRPPPGPPRRPPAAPAPENKELSWDDVQPVDVHGTGGRLPPGAAGRQDPERRSAGAHPRRAPQALAGAGLPGACRAHPRQPGPRAEYLPHQPRRRAGRRRASSTPSASWPSIPDGCSASSQGIETRDPAFGMEAVWIEPARSRSRADTRLYGGRCQHRDRDPSQPHHPVACA